MIIRGEPEPSRLVPPRSTKVGAAPGLPEVCATLSPAIAPERACAGLEKEPVESTSAFTVAIELVTLAFF